MSLSHLNLLDQNLIRYFKNNCLPEIYEAILTGLIIVQPKDHIQFIINCITTLHQGNITISREMFVAEHLRPSLAKMIKFEVSSIFFTSSEYEPSEDLKRIAYAHCMNKIMRKYFNCLMQNHIQQNYKKNRKKIMKKRIDQMVRIKCLFVYFGVIKEKYLEIKGVRMIALSIMKKVITQSLGRLIINLWRQQVRETKCTREYFEKLEMADNVSLESSTQETLPGSDEISMLPISLSSAIFSYLDLRSLLRCEGVSRSWNAIVQTNTLLSRINFNGCENLQSDTFVCRQLRRARPFLISLNLRNSLIKKESYLAVSLCPNIVDLNMSSCRHLNNHQICNIAKSCLNLTYLNISHTILTDVALKKISRECRKLKFLNIAFCVEITEKGIYFLANGCLSKNLEYLDISGCGQITYRGFFELANGCVNIKTLIINQVPGITDECLKCIGEKMLQIEHISLIGATRLTDRAIQYLYKEPKNINKIEIGYNSFVTNEMLRLTNMHCQSVSTLNLVNCFSLNDKGMILISMLPNLRKLNISNCIRISDNGVRNITEGSCGPFLTDLNLTNCYLIGNIAIQSISRRCSGLICLSLCYCDQIASQSLESLTNLQQLVTLDLSGCCCTDQTLAALNSNRMLSSLALVGCLPITDYGLQKLTYQYSQLEHLNLSNCRKLTDTGIKILSLNCRYLKTLKLSGCFGLTDTSIKCISTVCPHLTKLDLSGCDLLSNRTLKLLTIGCKRLEYLKLVGCTAITPKNAKEVSNVFQKVEFCLSSHNANKC